MSLRGFAPAMALLWAVALAPLSDAAPPTPWKPMQPPRLISTPAESTGRTAAKTPVRSIGGEPDTGQFLPDTVLLARVGDRRIRVGDYVSAFFNSYAEYRPRPDSAGRVEFLTTIVNKEVLGLTALGINRPMNFEDRTKLREHTQRVLSNTLFQRAVAESATVTEDEIRQVYEQCRYRQHMRHILVGERAVAEKVRADLVAGRIAWKDAVRKYSIAPDRERDGDLGWTNRLEFDPVLALQVYGLEPGQISPVVRDAAGYQLVQPIERKPEQPPEYHAAHELIRDRIASVKVAQRGEALQGIMRDEIGMTYDAANIAWASAQFAPSRRMGGEGQGPSVEFNTDLPEFSPPDTARVLARHRYGRLTLGDFLENYMAIQPLARPNVNDPEGMRGFINAVVLEPRMAEMAARRGLDKDPLAVRQIESKREEILVDHLYEDSITSRVWVTPAERRKYYQEHLAGFITFPKVSYAAFARASRSAADSLAQRLRSGEKAEDLLRADSLMGRRTGSLQERSANDHGTPYYKLLFEELRPGQVSVEGPDRKGDYAVLQLLHFDPGHQLGFQEVEHVIDESLQNIHAEAMLKAFVERHKKPYRIESHPELLGRVRMVDPTLLN